MSASANCTITVVIPIYNDWESFVRLVIDIDALSLPRDISLNILAVDDGSIEALDNKFTQLHQIHKVEILQLVSNMGHQRAIAVGLSEVARNDNCIAAIVMDGDGEDQPKDILTLIHAHQESPERIIVAKRGKRSETLAFRLFYVFYKWLFYLLTGVAIDFGNFAFIPTKFIRKLAYTPYLWNHFSAAVTKSRLPLLKIYTERGKRYAGESKMNLTALVVHGLSAVSVYVEIVFVRMLLFFSFIAFITTAGILVVLGIRYLTSLAIPGWATMTIGLLVLIILQTISFLLVSSFVMLSTRSQPSLIPIFEASKLIYKREIIIQNERNI